MVIPEQITLLPRFMYFRWLGIFDTHAALIVNSVFSITTVFFVRQYMLSIPPDYSDSARIDGAGHLRTWWSVIMPMTKPAVATLALLKFIWTWNDYINPLIFLSDPKLYTIQIGIKSFADKYGQYYSLIMAASVSAIIPLFVLFLIGQKYILEGITMSGLKG
jgi:multiple sugar transport system permease protein